MQTAHVKYVKTKNQTLFLFYHENNTLYYKMISPNGNTHPQPLAENISPFFSVSDYENEVFVLYSSNNGDLTLAKTTDYIHWDKNQLMHNKKELCQTKFLMVPDQANFHIIYHLPTETTGIHSLVYASFQNGKWEQPYRIDRFLPFAQVPFFTGRINQHHIILYYRTARNVISAREMLLSPYTLGSINPIIQTPYPCTDLSIINDTERIHILYTVKGMFRTQVVYQYKQSTSISTPRVLWEDTHCDNCLVYQQDGHLHLMWVAAGQPYRCSSDNNGNSFATVEKYTAPFPKLCIKSEFSMSYKDYNALNTAEAYTDGNNGYQLALFEQPKETLSPTSSLSSQMKPSQPKQPVENFGNAPNDTNFYAFYHSQKEQIEELSRLLAQRAEELSAINVRWKEQIYKLEESNKASKINIAQLEEKNQQLQERNRQLQENVDLPKEKPNTELEE